MSICLPDSWATRLIQTLIWFICRHARSSLLLEPMVSPMRGHKSFQIPLCPFSYSQHAICFCIVQETGLLTHHMPSLMEFTRSTQFYGGGGGAQTKHTHIQATFANIVLYYNRYDPAGERSTNAGSTLLHFSQHIFFVSHLILPAVCSFL